MREIKFRGKSKLSADDMELLNIKHDNGWVYGYYVNGYIVGPVVESTEEYFALEWWCPVYKKTVGQYTGIKDKKRQEIYEGHIISTDLGRPYLIVECKNDSFMYQCHDSGVDYYDILVPVEPETEVDKYGEIIGDIHDNPELLKGD